jgi:hypothetical protein
MRLPVGKFRLGKLDLVGSTNCQSRIDASALHMVTLLNFLPIVRYSHERIAASASRCVAALEATNTCVSNHTHCRISFLPFTSLRCLGFVLGYFALLSHIILHLQIRDKAVALKFQATTLSTLSNKTVFSIYVFPPRSCSRSLDLVVILRYADQGLGVCLLTLPTVQQLSSEFGVRSHGLNTTLRGAPFA